MRLRMITLWIGNARAKHQCDAHSWEYVVTNITGNIFIIKLSFLISVFTHLIWNGVINYGQWDIKPVVIYGQWGIKPVVNH